MMYFTQEKHFIKVLFAVSVCYNEEGWILLNKKKSYEQTVMLVVKVMCVNFECSHCCKLCRFVGVLMTKIAVFSSEETRRFRRNVDAAILNVKSSD